MSNYHDRLQEHLDSGNITAEEWELYQAKIAQTKKHPGLIILGGSALTLFSFGFLGWIGAVGAAAIGVDLLWDWLKENDKEWKALDRLEAQAAPPIAPSPRVIFAEPNRSLVAIEKPEVLEEVVEVQDTISFVVPPIASRPAAKELYGGNWRSTTTAAGVEQTDLALQLARKLTSRIIAAAPRTGKGALVTRAMGYVQELRPDVELWALDIKGCPLENSYYTPIDPSRLLRMNLMEWDKPEGCDEQIAEFFRDFSQSIAKTKLLWINEVVTLSAKADPALWRNIKNFAVGLCSAGATGNDGQTGRFMWFDTQSPNTTDLGLSTNASRNVFRRVFLMNEDKSLLGPATSSGFAIELPDQELSKLRSTGSRVVAYDSYSGLWVALPNVVQPEVPDDPPPTASSSPSDREVYLNLASESPEPTVRMFAAALGKSYTGGAMHDRFCAAREATIS